MINTRAAIPSQKTINLIIKCIVRAAQNFTNELKVENIKDFFIKMNEYLELINFGLALEEFSLSAH